ncbi:MAG: RMD1 family protein [Polyangiaceae bacterium]|nr:RMD1 family protein [Myxococcales bacterium]MCB9587582.1 RMD1 family protein [Polyangiaceae bacterium]MCB9605621.1 RMD1 family protein [Polyangiaceae bacterium]
MVASVADPPPNVGHPADVSVQAILLGERIDVQRLDGERLASGAVLLGSEAAPSAIVFRHGTVVCFDLSSTEQNALIARLQHQVKDAFSDLEREGVTLKICEETQLKVSDPLTLPNRSLEVLLVVADVLAKSVSLARSESRIGATFERIEPLAVHLERTGKVDRRSSELVRQVAAMLLIEHRMVGRLEIADKPELLWERPDLERLYLALADEFELSERDVVLKRKLTLLNRSAELFLNLLNEKRSLRVEWYIVALIVVEIGLSVYDLLARG